MKKITMIFILAFTLVFISACGNNKQDFEGGASTSESQNVEESLNDTIDEETLEEETLETEESKEEMIEETSEYLKTSQDSDFFTIEINGEYYHLNELTLNILSKENIFKIDENLLEKEFGPGPGATDFLTTGGFGGGFILIRNPGTTSIKKGDAPITGIAFTLPPDNLPADVSLSFPYLPTGTKKEVDSAFEGYEKDENQAAGITTFLIDNGEITYNFNDGKVVYISFVKDIPYEG